MLAGGCRYGYASLELTKQPGTRFGYSGGGFLVLQHLLELREGRPIAQIMVGGGDLSCCRSWRWWYDDDEGDHGLPFVSTHSVGGADMTETDTLCIGWR
eukprot:COSAG01_NODE_1560_length_9921_cov_30.121551_4_plen_99_part_00